LRHSPNYAKLILRSLILVSHIEIFAEELNLHFSINQEAK